MTNSHTHTCAIKPNYESRSLSHVLLNKQDIFYYIYKSVYFAKNNKKTFFCFFADTPYCYNANKRTIIEVKNEESAQLECLIRSSGPISDIRFNWYINSSAGGQVAVLPSHFKNNGTKSYLRYTIKKGMPRETIICQASNAAGSSNQPCTFIVTTGLSGTGKHSFWQWLFFKY